MTSKPVVLVVEDDPAFAHDVATFVAAEGFEVRVEADGLLGLGSLRQPPTPVLIVLDLLIPGVDGWHFYAEMQRNPNFPKVPVVVVTGAGNIEGAPPLNGVLDHIRKPGADAELRAAFFNLLGVHLRPFRSLTGQAGGGVGAHR